MQADHGLVAHGAATLLIADPRLSLQIQQLQDERRLANTSHSSCSPAQTPTFAQQAGTQPQGGLSDAGLDDLAEESEVAGESVRRGSAPQSAAVSRAATQVEAERASAPAAPLQREQGKVHDGTGPPTAVLSISPKGHSKLMSLLKGAGGTGGAHKQEGKPGKVGASNETKLDLKAVAKARAKAEHRAKAAAAERAARLARVQHDKADVQNMAGDRGGLVDGWVLLLRCCEAAECSAVAG